MQNRAKGFSLLELMTALAVAGVVLGIAAPSFNEFRRNNRLTGVANDFLAAVQIARTEAIKRQQIVSICSTTDVPTDPDAECTLGDFTSWLVFVDTNGNCLRAGVNEIILKADGPIDDNVDTDSNGDCISFAPTGFVRVAIPGGATAATRTLYCDDRNVDAQSGTNQSAGRGIAITNTGRSRITRDITSGATSDISTWADLTSTDCTT